jgi:hypothetical protein
MTTSQIEIAKEYFTRKGIKKGLNQKQATALIILNLIEALGLELTDAEKSTAFEVVYPGTNVSAWRQTFEKAGLLEKSDGKRGEAINALGYL